MISVFGSTGFIGSNWCNLYPEISFKEERSSINPKFDTILYFRSTNSNYNIFKDVSLDVNTNLLLFTETLKNITKKNNFILISSWFCEYPRGFYSITKLTQEMLLESYCKTYDFSYKIIRLSNVIGGDIAANSQKNALEMLINKIKKNEDIEIYKGDNYRNFIDVQFCCESIKRIIEDGENHGHYNLGNRESYRIIDLLKYCINKINSKSQIKIIPTPDFHKLVQIKDYWMDTEKIQKLGISNNMNIYKTLDKLLWN